MLSPERRIQLDGIVQKLDAQGAPVADVQAIVADFKSKYDVPEVSKSKLDTFGEIAQKTRSVIPGVAIGQIKGLGSTVLSLGSLGSRALESGYDATVGKLTGKKAVSSAPLVESLRPAVTPQGAAQKVGFATEQLAEFLTPVGAEAAAARGTEAVTKAVKLSPRLVKATEIFGKTLASMAEVGAKTTAQTGDISRGLVTGLVAGPFTVAAEIAQPVLKASLPKAANMLERMNLRLTPVQQRDLGTKIDDAINVITRERITGSPQARLDKINDVYQRTEDTLQKFLQSDAKAVTVNKQQLIDEAEKLKSLYQNDRDVRAIESQVDEFITLLKTKYEDAIPLWRLNELKRSTYQNAYNAAGTKVRDDVEHGIGDVLRRNIEGSTTGLKINGKDIGAFNKEYGDIITARNLIKASQGRKQLGLVGSLVSHAVGGALGQAMGGPIGTAIGTAVGGSVAQGVAGTASRSALSSALTTGEGIYLPGITQALQRIFGGTASLTGR